MRNFLMCVGMMAVLSVGTAWASPPMSPPVSPLMSPITKKYISQPAVVGTGRLSVAFWDIYDARLIAPSGALNNKEPFALELDYLVDISGKDIAKRTIQEMESQGFSDTVKLAQWQGLLTTMLPDVQNGSRLTGVSTAQGETVFYKNDQNIGTIKDKEFGRQFFAIWLGEKTSEPDLRRSLLGLR
jgi:hypothetical protein